MSLQRPWVEHWEEESLKEMEGPVREVIEDGRAGAGKAPGGGTLPCRPSGTCFSCSAINPLLGQREQ